MSLTVFLAMCVLGVDFLIYFLFKLLYGEKRRISPRRLPPEYYKRNEEAFSLILLPAPKDRLPSRGQVISMPRPARQPASKGKPGAHTSRASLAENLAYRRITAAFAQSKSRT